jgi:hypothetical protein
MPSAIQRATWFLFLRSGAAPDGENAQCAIGARSATLAPMVAAMIPIPAGLGGAACDGHSDTCTALRRWLLESRLFRGDSVLGGQLRLISL